MSQIAPCPACGDESEWEAEHNGMYFVSCCVPGCMIGPTFASKTDAIVAWNRLSAAATLATAARAWLAEVERVDPLPADQCVLGGVTVGLIRATGDTP